MKPRSRKFALLALGGLVAMALAGCGPENFKPKTTGSDEIMNKVKAGEPMYTPPANVPTMPDTAKQGGGAPGGAPGMPSGAPTSPPGPPR